MTWRRTRTKLLCAMVSAFSVPVPVKRIFDTFPLKVYSAQADKDEAVTLEVQRRSYAFAERRDGSSELTVEGTYKLGVYNVFSEATTGAVLATDPWCLFVQLALCQKNGLYLPTQSQEQDSPYSCKNELIVLSRLSNPDETLPILVEGYKKRIVRSTEAISETMRTRILDDAEQLMYHTLLDTVLYDCWISQILFCASNSQFMELYSSQRLNNSSTAPLDVENSLLRKLSVNSLKLSLSERNKFQFRHREIVKGLCGVYHHHRNNVNQEQVLNVLFENTKQILLDFKGTLKSGEQPTSLHLKIASYILCIINVKEPIKIKTFVENECKELVCFAQETLKTFVR